MNMGKKELVEILQRLNIYTKCSILAAGGAVRDSILGTAVKDVDLVFRGPEEELKKFLRELQTDYKKIDPASSLPIYSFSFDETRMEITLPRKEKKLVSEGNSHKNFEFVFDHTIPLVEDAKRRDFTVNALYMNRKGKILDPLGGLKDLANMELVQGSDAFIEDPLRVLRALRFAAKGFKISDKLKNLILQNKELLENEINKLPVERLTSEFMKSLDSKNFAQFFVNFIDLNLNIDLFTFIYEMNTIPAGPEKYHGKNTVLQHSIETAEKVCQPDRLYAFFHDFGKIFTPKDILPHHYNHEVVGEEKVKELLQKMKLPAKAIERTSFITRQHMAFGRFAELKNSTKLKILEKAVKLDCVRELISVVSADHGRMTREAVEEIYRIVDIIQTPASKIIPLERLQRMEKNKIKEIIFQKKLELINK